MFTPAQGLFVGLTTLDLIYQAAGPPTANQKMVALDYAVAAGGPATNAAVAFQAVGGRSTLLTSLGCHAITALIRADLAECQVTIADLTPDRPDPPPVSSIIVTAETGDRAVVCINAVKRQVSAADLPRDRLQAVDVVLIDGHQIDVGAAIAQQAKAQKIPTILDGGSWKPGLEKILPYIDYAICSANFHAPSDLPVHRYLAACGIAQIAITHGEQPIQYWSPTATGSLSIPLVPTVDTLGAGDIFHGAFCHAILRQDFVSALKTAAQVASHSCTSFGTRRWMQDRPV